MLENESSQYSSPVHCLYTPIILMWDDSVYGGCHYKHIVTITHFVSDSVKLPCCHLMSD